eukprot:NODE_10573_length_586_cov_67.786177_g10296_i0.p1 GENE.NODE_10573_length_586_cov_67.786177_g10296_i0~~NODE_10573_length_586_cov_67.786177_g10296_i0.p1  ORF type:complete len:154 (+),score=26.97 NODE_10573_length_586_cov_67.786177_g10296_i0:18-479(+)
MYSGINAEYMGFSAQLEMADVYNPPTPPAVKTNPEEDGATGEGGFIRRRSSVRFSLGASLGFNLSLKPIPQVDNPTFQVVQPETTDGTSWRPTEGSLTPASPAPPPEPTYNDIVPLAPAAKALSLRYAMLQNMQGNYDKPWLWGSWICVGCPF